MIIQSFNGFNATSNSLKSTRRLIFPHTQAGDFMVAKLYLRCLDIMFGLFCMCRTSSSLSCSLELRAPGHAARGNPSGGNFTGAIKLENKGKITCHIPPLFPRTFCPSVILRRFTSAGYVTVQGSRRARGSAGRPLIPLSH